MGVVRYYFLVGIIDNVVVSNYLDILRRCNRDTLIISILRIIYMLIHFKLFKLLEKFIALANKENIFVQLIKFFVLIILFFLYL